MGRILDAVHSAAQDLAAGGYDLGVLGARLPGLLRGKADQVFVIFATPRAVAWAESLGVESAGEPPGTVLRRAMVPKLLKQAKRAGLKVNVEWRSPRPIESPLNARQVEAKLLWGLRRRFRDARYVVVVVNYAEVSVALRFLGGRTPGELGRSFPPAEPVPEKEIKSFLLQAAITFAIATRPLPCAIVDRRVAPNLPDVN